MKIYFVSHSSEMAGAEQSLIRLVDAAILRGHRVQVSVPRTGSLVDSMHAKFGGECRISEIPTHWWMGMRSSGAAGFIRILQCLTDVPRFVREYQRVRPDAVVLNTSVTPAPLMAAAVLRIPVVTIIRESITSNPTLRSFLPKSVIRRAIDSLSAGAVSVSRFVAHQYGYPSVVIHPQIDPVFLTTDEEIVGPKQSRALLRGVMLGYFTPEKGQVEAIQAIRYVHDSGIPMTLDIYGAGSAAYYQLMMETIRLNDLGAYVRVHSPTNKALDILRDADVSLVCSRNEAFGKVTAESILAGTPVVAYALGGTCEILELGGGRLVEPSSMRLAEELVSLNRNPATVETLRSECATKNLRLRLENTAGEIIELIESVVSRV